jgi:nicotinamidase/pyrazinamidase
LVQSVRSRRSVDDDGACVIDRERSALLLVDVQADFMPGGALAVADGDAILRPIARLLTADRFAAVIATQDWHPPGHVSFASSHPGRRPFDHISLHGHDQGLCADHCLMDSPGAALHPQLPPASIDAIVRKGTERDVDSYSGFRNNWNAAGQRAPTGLARLLRDRGLTDVYVVGLAREVCVMWTAEDAAQLGFRTAVIWDLTRPMNPANDTRVRAALSSAGVRVVDSGQIRS